MNYRWIPNAITLFRLILLIPVLALLHQQQYVLATTIYFIALLLDGIDGWAARKLRAESILGQKLDLFVDGVSGYFILILLLIQQKLTLAVTLAIVLIGLLQLHNLIRGTQRAENAFEHPPNKNLIGGTYFGYILALMLSLEWVAWAFIGAQLILQILSYQHFTKK